MSGFPAGFDILPVLTGERVRLRPLGPQDLSPLFAVACDRRIWEQHPAHDRWQPDVFGAFFDEAIRQGGGLVAEAVDTGEVIGSSRFSTLRALSGEVEIGWTFLARRYWGTGINPEMKTLMLDHAFGVFEAAIFVIGKGNLRSRLAIERIGARLTDRRLSVQMAGQAEDHLVYRIERDPSARQPSALASPITLSVPDATS